MGFDWGSAVASGINTGLRTYGHTKSLMDDEEQRRKDREAEEIAKGTVGKVGTDVVDTTQQNMGAANPDEFSPRTKKYTEAEAYRDQATRLAGAGQFDRAAKARSTGLLIEKGDLDVKDAKRRDVDGERKARIQTQVDKIMEQSQRLMNDPKAAADFIKEQYNSNKGEYNDGHSMDYVSTAQGPMAVFQDKTGKVVNTMPVTQETAWNAIRTHQIKQLAALSPEYAEQADRHFDRLLDQRLKLNQDRRNENADQRGADQNNREQQLLPGRMRLQDAQVSSARASAAHSSEATAVLRRNREALEGAQPMFDAFKALSPEQQSGPEGKKILRDAQIHLASKSGDIAKMFDLDKKDAKNIEIKSNSDGSGFTIFHKGPEGAVPLGVVGENGALLPAGMSPQNFAAETARARKAGVGITVGVVNGRATVGYQGKDGEVYPTLEEAARAYGGSPQQSGSMGEPNLQRAAPRGQAPTQGYAPWFAATQAQERQREEELRRRQQAGLSGYLPR